MTSDRKSSTKKRKPEEESEHKNTKRLVKQENFFSATSFILSSTSPPSEDIAPPSSPSSPLSTTSSKEELDDKKMIIPDDYDTELEFFCVEFVNALKSYCQFLFSLGCREAQETTRWYLDSQDDVTDSQKETLTTLLARFTALSKNQNNFNIKQDKPLPELVVGIKKVGLDKEQMLFETYFNNQILLHIKKEKGQISFLIDYILGTVKYYLLGFGEALSDWSKALDNRLTADESTLDSYWKEDIYLALINGYRSSNEIEKEYAINYQLIIFLHEVNYGEDPDSRVLQHHLGIVKIMQQQQKYHEVIEWVDEVLREAAPFDLPLRKSWHSSFSRFHAKDEPYEFHDVPFMHAIFHIEKGVACLELGKDQMALDCFKTAIILVQQAIQVTERTAESADDLLNLNQLGVAWYYQGMIQIKAKEFKPAITSLQQSLKHHSALLEDKRGSSQPEKLQLIREDVMAAHYSLAIAHYFNGESKESKASIDYIQDNLDSMLMTRDETEADDIMGAIVAKWQQIIGKEDWAKFAEFYQQILTLRELRADEPDGSRSINPRQ